MFFSVFALSQSHFVCLRTVVAALPFLKNTRVILYPLTMLLLVYIICVLIGCNLSRGLCHFYAMRV